MVKESVKHLSLFLFIPYTCAVDLSVGHSIFLIVPGVSFGWTNQHEFGFQGGVEANVIPPKLFATVDFRVAIDFDLKKFEDQVSSWAAQSGEGISIRFIQKNNLVAPTVLDETNPYWTAMKKQLDDMYV